MLRVTRAAPQSRANNARVRITLAIAAATCPCAMLPLTACTYSRVVRARTPLAGLPGAEGGTVVGDRYESGNTPGLATPTSQNYILHDDGSVELLTYSVSALMLHIRGVLENDNAEMFVEQLLSQRTADEFRGRGRDPGEAFTMLKQNERAFYALFSRMPAGEATPGVFMNKLGDRTYRVALTGLAARDLEWHAVDVVYEDREWKLRWFK